MGELSRAQSEHQMQRYQDDLPRPSEASSISGILSCHQSIILWVWLICNFFFLTPKLCSNPEIPLVFPESYFPFFFFLIWFFAALTLSVHSSVSEIYFWLLGQANMLIIFLSPRRLWNTIALIIYIPITLQWEIHYFKLNHLFLVYFCHHLSLMPCIA